MQLTTSGKSTVSSNCPTSNVSGRSGGGGGTGTKPPPISPDVYCNLCSVAFNSDKQAVQHYSGKTHAKRRRADQTLARVEARTPGTASDGDLSSSSSDRDAKSV